MFDIDDVILGGIKALDGEFADGIASLQMVEHRGMIKHGNGHFDKAIDVQREFNIKLNIGAKHTHMRHECV